MKIVLACVAGLSTTMMMDSMKKVIKDSKKLNIDDFNLMAIPVEQLPAEIEGTDVVLLGPQVSYKSDFVESVTKPLNIPYVVIDKDTYGQMDGGTVIKEALIAQRKQQLKNQADGGGN
ncbi:MULTISPECIES: PTS sugar transporter subunit IIB [Lacticaseibacillus]|jgi:PTS system cellobiose-specific IIB component|uniref:PTS sugar transporter subunit IIB n=1 Tax=Lacticaseibacillus TaxID=2759736 RepID=UPI00192B9E18|nr:MULTISPECIES: PTS sugar transporter subunit IIB [Lacticaseibacillus]MCI2038441.1 PTS sugar transporter subunit IIB [Lactobacillus sp.]CAD7483390.1 Lichenan-specific phosphotransferase enzyme IIB component [Lacticaseibacillus paracasei]